ncbi:MAG: lamin tail domain-containing protein [Bacteroidales bacterium]|nr:lamin tail domain-containing protein [Bacteroidales bacterium]
MRKFLIALMVCVISSNIAIGQNKTIIINELMADNTDNIADESGEYEDWIEIYNYGDKPVDIGGLYFTDDIGVPKTFRIPPGNDSTIIPSHSFILLWADDEWEEGIFHIEFKLSRKGEQVAIFDADGETFIDSITFPAQLSNRSWGRKSANNSEWVEFDVPTPGNSNN